jgi:hypothetical protein
METGRGSLLEKQDWAAHMSHDFVRTLDEIDDYFMKRGPVHATVRRLASRLAELRIPYAIIGGMALSAHGFVRPTEDVDVLLTTVGLEQFTTSCLGLGYVPAFPGARKSFRDTETGVRIEVITQGEYPGDGEPKPVVFPNPADVSIDESGISIVNLRSLVELKLASGLSAPHRLRDLADVQELIARLAMPSEFAAELDASVRDEYLRLWDAVDRARRIGLERDGGTSP